VYAVYIVETKTALIKYFVLHNSVLPEICLREVRNEIHNI